MSDDEDPIAAQKQGGLMNANGNVDDEDLNVNRIDNGEKVDIEETPSSTSSGSDYTTDSEGGPRPRKRTSKRKTPQKKAVITGANFLNKLRGKKESSSSSSSSSEQEEIDYYSDEVENIEDLVKALEVTVLNESEDESWDPAMGKRVIVKETCGSLRIHTTQIREDIINEQAKLKDGLAEAKLKLYEYETDVHLKALLPCLIQNLKEKLAKIQERMDYENNRIVVYRQGDEGATKIGKQPLENKYLKRLRLIDAEIGPKGCKALAPAIKRHRRLEHLGLKFNYIEPAGVKFILKASRHNRRGGLKELDLYGCKLGPEGAKVIADELKQNTFLEVLRLRFNGIAPEGAAALAECSL